MLKLGGMLKSTPAYLQITQERLLGIRDELLALLGECTLCPRLCRSQRHRGKTGFCKTGRKAIVSSYNLHFGEEPELVGEGGSGTIFFSFCNLGCVYCQNHPISDAGEGRDVTADELASVLLELQRLGAENLNFVSPTHVVPQIVEALSKAREKGLRLPLVYNSGGYDSRAVIKRLGPIFDIYMPDIKYSRNQSAEKYSCVTDYWERCKESVLEMHRQVGDLMIDERGVALRGLLIRHLVLPEDISGSSGVIDFVADSLSANTYLNIMDQYRPCHKAYMHPKLMRRITDKEYADVVDYARSKGVQRGFEAL